MSEIAQVPNNVHIDLSEYHTIHDQVESMRKQSSELNKRGKELGETIQEFMRKHNLETLNTKSGTVTLKKTQRPIALNRDNLYPLVRSFQDMTDESAQSLVAHIFDNRPTKEVAELRRKPQKKTTPETK